MHASKQNNGQYIFGVDAATGKAPSREVLEKLSFGFKMIESYPHPISLNLAPILSQKWMQMAILL